MFDESWSLLWRSEVEYGSRAAVHDWDGDGVREIVVSSARPFGTTDWVEALHWNGEIFQSMWRSIEFQGSVAAMCPSDLDDDGRDELAVAVTSVGEGRGRVLFFGATGGLGDKEGGEQ